MRKLDFQLMEGQLLVGHGKSSMHRAVGRASVLFVCGMRLQMLFSSGHAGRQNPM